MISSRLFSPLNIRDLQLKNRIVMAPMCQYSAVEGVPSEWHRVHYGARAQGGVGLIIIEATGVTPNGRISEHCLGIYNDRQLEAYKEIVSFAKSQGTTIGIQLAHSGRKGTGSFNTVAPSAIPFSPDYKVPKEMTKENIQDVVQAFADAAGRALSAGFDVVEIHSAHGYLLHEFLSPYSNHRTDEFGGSLENRMRLPLMVAKTVRAAWPQHLPVLIRISATDWIQDRGWSIEESVIFCRELKKLGIDMVDVSTGGNVFDAKIPVGPHYQVPFATKIKNESGTLTSTVGLITEAKKAEEILVNEEADAITLGRALLRDPYWAINAAKILNADNIVPIVPRQYKLAY